MDFEILRTENIVQSNSISLNQRGQTLTGIESNAKDVKEKSK
jgi:hypothetical protein